jgi:mono/diheme cytochrome c family protein
MQDQPRYKAYKESDFFSDKRASRDLPDGTVARGKLKDNKAFYTGKVDNPNLSAPVQTTTDASGNTLVSSFPNDIDEFPVPVTKELVDRGQERYNIYCIVCHGPTGNGDGMIVRRGFPKPPTYHDDRLRNAPVGHFFDVMSNGWGKMNSYAAQVQPADRWAIVAYIRTLQVSENPEMVQKMNAERSTATPASTNGGNHK